MPLFWMAYADGPRVFISDAGGEPGMIKASQAGLKGRPTEIHTLDEKIAKQIPKAMIGRVPTQKEAQALLRKIGG